MCDSKAQLKQGLKEQLVGAKKDTFVFTALAAVTPGTGSAAPADSGNIRSLCPEDCSPSNSGYTWNSQKNEEASILCIKLALNKC